MGSRLVPFIPDGWIEYDNLSDECMHGIAEEIPSFVPPVGFVYTQYYGCSAPWEVFPDVIESNWEKLYSTEGLFFCTEGGDSPDFDGTIKEDQFQGHNHNFKRGLTAALGAGSEALTTGGSISAEFVRTAIADGTNGTPRTGSTTRPKSVTIRVWKRIL